MKAILIGYGEIGKAVYEVFSPYHKFSICDLKLVIKPPKESYDIMLVTIPYQDNFIKTVETYQKKYNPKATIIFSTVAIGTTSQIPNAVHSPVEGKHPKLAYSIKLMRRWVGGTDKNAIRFFTEADFIPKVLAKPEHTEFLKLSSTSLYGLNIEFARYRKSVADGIGLDYGMVKKFDEHYNELYRELGLGQYQRYILDPPRGNLGGHCVVPNAEILDKQFPNVFLKEIYRNKEVKE